MWPAAVRTCFSLAAGRVAFTFSPLVREVVDRAEEHGGNTHRYSDEHWLPIQGSGSQHHREDTE